MKKRKSRLYTILKDNSMDLEEYRLQDAEHRIKDEEKQLLEEKESEEHIDEDM